jgi:hypothetical protein
MKHRFIAAVTVAGTLAGIALPGCEETPDPRCVLGAGEYAAKYILESQQGTGTCGDLQGEVIGVRRFEPADGGIPVAFLPEGANQTREGEFLALARLPTQEAPDRTCTATDPTPISTRTAATRIPLLPDGGLPPDAGVDLDAGTVVSEGDAGFLELEPSRPIRYAFEDFRFFVLPPAPSAAQFETRLTFTDGDCSATYKVVAVFPAARCGTADGAPDDSLCITTPDYDAGRLLGSGINPRFDTFCHPGLRLCVLRADTIGEATLKQ